VIDTLRRLGYTQEAEEAGASFTSVPRNPKSRSVVTAPEVPAMPT
jgi:hypothetical protein